jgi:anti-anti-sigma factor
VVADKPPLQIEHTPTGRRVIGEIDAHTADVLRAQLLPDTDSGGDDVRVDISAVTFIDSSGLRVLLEAHRALQQAGRRLVLVAPSRPVVRLFEVTGLTGALDVEPPLGTAH